MNHIQNIKEKLKSICSCCIRGEVNDPMEVELAPYEPQHPDSGNDQVAPIANAPPAAAPVGDNAGPAGPAADEAAALIVGDNGVPAVPVDVPAPPAPVEIDNASTPAVAVQTTVPDVPLQLPIKIVPFQADGRGEEETGESSKGKEREKINQKDQLVPEDILSTPKNKQEMDDFIQQYAAALEGTVNQKEPKYVKIENCDNAYRLVEDEEENDKM
jgi:hypothetical protein